MKLVVIRRVNEATIMIKFAISYLQVLYVLSTLDIPLPSAVSSAMLLITNPGERIVNSSDCLLVGLFDRKPDRDAIPFAFTRAMATQANVFV